MGKFFAVLIVLVSFRASIWATEVEFDLSYYKTTSRSYKFEEGAEVEVNSFDGTSTFYPIEEVKGNSPFGIKQNVAIFFGSQNTHLVSVGLGIGTGLDFGLTYKYDGRQVTNSDRLTMGMNLVVGPAIRIKPVSFLSLHIQPALGIDTFYTTNRFMGIDSIYGIVDFTFNCDVGAKLWLTKHFGFNAGVNVSKPMAGAFVYTSKDNDGNSADGTCIDLNDGFIYKFYVGVSWGWGKR